MQKHPFQGQRVSADIVAPLGLTKLTVYQKPMVPDYSLLTAANLQTLTQELESVGIGRQLDI